MSNNNSDGFGGSWFEKLSSAVMYPIRTFMSEAFSSGGRSSSMSSDRSFGQSLLHWATSPIRFLFAFAVFLVQAWASSRSGWRFLLGFPAIAVAGVFAGGIWLTGFYQSRIIGCQQLTFNDVLTKLDEPEERAEAFEQRVMLAEHILNRKPDSETGVYQLGLAKGAAGDLSGAMDVMTRLAPDDSPGLSEAHLWRASFYQDPKLHTASDEDRDEIVLKHLDLAIAQSPDNSKAHQQMAEIHLRKAATYDEGTEEYLHHSHEAREHSMAMIREGIRSIPGLQAASRIVQLDKRLDGIENAKQRFKLLKDNQFDKLTKQNPNVFEVWLVLVQCALELEDYDMAQRFIREGFVTSDSDQTRKKVADLLALVLLRQADEADDMGDRRQYMQRLQSLSQAINVSPTNEEVYRRLVKFISSDAGENYNPEWFEEAKVGTANLGVLHAMSGLRAIIDGDRVTARTHWRVSQQVFTLSELVLNHLILVGAKTDIPDFSDPVSLLSEALDAFPGNPVMLQTRGYYYMKADRYQDAVEDLESAIETLPNLVEARQFLILLYEELNQPNEVARHRQQMDDVLTNVPEDRREKLIEQLEAIEL